MGFFSFKLPSFLQKKAQPKPEPTPPAPQPEVKKEVVWERPRRRINQAGIDLIKGFEGLVLEAYPDPASPLSQACVKANLRGTSYKKIPGWEKLSGAPWTIGYGHTGSDVTIGRIITQAEAEALLRKDLDRFEKAVEDLISVPLTDNQFAALVSFAYNCGPKNLEISTLRKKLQARDYLGAAEQFKVWVKAAGKTLPGLVRRRAAESELFLKV